MMFKLISGMVAQAAYSMARGSLSFARWAGGDRYAGQIGRKHRDCCYGENRWQSPAALFQMRTRDPLALNRFEVIVGSEPSYVNWRDIDRLLQTMTHTAATFLNSSREVPLIAVGCKHGNPCGAAVGKDDPAIVTGNMVEGDPLALFGGIVMTNFRLTELLASVLLTKGGKRVLDGVVAPSFSKGARDMLRRGNDRCRLYENKSLLELSVASLNQEPLRVPVRGGFLRQPNYTFVLDTADQELERIGGPLSLNMERDLLLAWAVGSTSNSNTITLVKNGALIGSGVGQQDRVGCCDVALSRAWRSQHDLQGAAAYSDSFFPFNDAPEKLIDAGVAAILTSSGSRNDDRLRQLCFERSVPLWMIPDSYGRGFFGH